VCLNIFLNALILYFLQVVSDDTLNQEGTGGTVVLLMVRDAYANYVVQTAIDVVPEGTEKRMLIDELKANEAHLVSLSFSVSYIFLRITDLFSHR